MNSAIRSSRVIVFAVKALIIHEAKFLAVHKSSDKSPDYELPGGKMIFGETAEETIVREVREETGLHVKPISLVDTWNYVAEALQVTGVIYLCTTENLEPIIISDEHDRYEWVSPDSGSLEKMNSIFKPKMITWNWDELICKQR